MGGVAPSPEDVIREFRERRKSDAGDLPFIQAWPGFL